MYKHAVLAQQGDEDYYEIMWDGNISRGFFAPSLPQLHAYMEEYKLDVLWTMPGSQFEKIIRAEHFLDLQGEGYDAYIPRDCLPDAKPQRRLYGARLRSISQKKGS